MLVRVSRFLVSCLTVRALAVAVTVTVNVTVCATIVSSPSFVGFLLINSDCSHSGQSLAGNPLDHLLTLVCLFVGRLLLFESKTCDSHSL